MQNHPGVQPGPPQGDHGRFQESEGRLRGHSKAVPRLHRLYFAAGLDFQSAGQRRQGLGVCQAGLETQPKERRGHILHGSGLFIAAPVERFQG